MTIEINDVQIETLKHAIATAFNEEVSARDEINSRRWDDPTYGATRLIKAREHYNFAQAALSTFGVYFRLNVEDYSKACKDEDVVLLYKGQEF